MSKIKLKVTTVDKITNTSIGLFLLILSIICIYPIIYILFASLSDPKLLIQHSGLLLKPLGFSIKGYEIALSYSAIPRGYKNTILVVTVGTILNMILTIFGAYGLSRKGMLLKKHLMFMIAITMFFNGGLIPFYLTVKGLGLLNSYFSLILPVGIWTFNLIILRTSMSVIPPALEESAILDGANDFVLLFKIILPLVKPTLAVLSLYYIVGHWNSWFNAMLFITERNKYPLQLILREILIANSGDAVQTQGLDLSEMDAYKRLVKYCTTIIATLPILFIYPFFKKYFVNGIMIGSLKG